MNRRVAVIGLVCAAALAAGVAIFANGGKSPQIGPSSVEAGNEDLVKQGERQVDWGAAAEKAARNSKNVVSAQSVGVDVDSPVPVLALPSISAQSVNSGGTQVKATSDGYYASFPGAKYDVIVTGTKTFYKAPASAPPPTVTTQSVDEFNYSTTETGAEVAFKQFGADYNVQFECKSGSAGCITEKEAREVVENLVMVGN
jgi:hypothetical protein